MANRKPVALDTQILIWGVREQVDPDFPQAVKRAKALIAKLQDERVPIVVPSVAAAEFLAGTDPNRVDEQSELLYSNFLVQPFDDQAADIAGGIQRDYKNLMKPELYGVGRQCLKSDLWIFATAVASGASTIYARDGFFHAIAKQSEFVGKIEAKEMPKADDKQKTFDDL